MKKKKLRRGLSLLLAVLIAGVCRLSGCGAQKNEAQENAETIQVYLWNTTLYENYAPYIQSQLPDVNIEFIVGNNDLDFYKFLNENGGLPDIITSCPAIRLHDAPGNAQGRRTRRAAPLRPGRQDAPHQRADASQGG